MVEAASAIEVLDGTAATGAAESVGQGSVAQEAVEGRGESGWVVHVDEEAGFAVRDYLGQAAGMSGDHRQTAGGGLGGSQPEALGAGWQHRHPAFGPEICRFGQKTDQLHVMRVGQGGSPG